MKKCKSEYYFTVPGFSEDKLEQIDVEVNEEFPTHIRVKHFQDRWRTKSDWIKLYKGIIKELESFNS